MTFAVVATFPAERVRVHVPQRGAWYADVTMLGDDDVAGAVVMKLGDVEFRGTVDPRYAGTFGLQRRVRIVAGGNGWGKSLPAKHYHNDAGVRARLVVEDAVREAGESIGTPVDPSLVLGVRYSRQVGEASRVLEDAVGSAWFVGYDGATNFGARSSSPATEGTYEVLAFDPRTRITTLAVDDVAAVGIGSVLDARLDSSETVHELEIDVDVDTVRLRAWLGTSTSARSRLGEAFSRVVERLTNGRIYGPRKYRVGRLSADRVELQVVNPAIGLPNLIPLSMWPGVAGVHCELTLGTEVLVQFVDGDRSQPVVTHFSGRDGTGWTPANTTIDAVTLIKLGAAATQFVALATDTKSRLDTLQNAHDTHMHPTAATGPASLPSVLVGPLGPIAATKVKAE